MYRMQFRLKGKAEALFRNIVDKTGEDPKEVVMDALALYHVALDEIANGRSFGAYSPDDKSFEGIWTPMLRAWKDKARGGADVEMPAEFVEAADTGSAKKEATSSY